MIDSRVSQLPDDIRQEYPFSSHLFGQPISSDDSVEAQMHYVDVGEGPVVLMLHGNPTWSFYYRNLARSLSEREFRCIVPDHIGCGLSDKPQSYSYTLQRRIEDIERLLDHLEIDEFSLVVHDWGGAIGCGVAGRRPNSLQKLVLLNTAAFCSKRIPLRIASIKVPLVGEAIIRGLNGFAGPAATMSVTKPLLPAVKAGFLWPYRTWNDRVAVWNFVRDIPLSEKHPSYQALFDVEKNLPKLQSKPVKLLWGAKDFCFNLHFYERWKVIFPNADESLHSDCGHYILEDGGAEVIEEIFEFLC